MLRGVVMMVDDDNASGEPITQAFFENAEDGGLFAEGEVTQVSPSENIGARLDWSTDWRCGRPHTSSTSGPATCHSPIRVRKLM